MNPNAGRGFHVSLGIDGMDAQTQRFMRMGGVFARARQSALKSVGYFVRNELKSFVASGGSGWAPKGPIAANLRKAQNAKQTWYRKRSPGNALGWLAPKARYQASDQPRLDVSGGELTAQPATVQIGFGYGPRVVKRTGQLSYFRPNQFDPQLDALVRRHEQGKVVPVSEAMRRKFGASRPAKRQGRTYKRGADAEYKTLADALWTAMENDAVRGLDFFPLKKSTTALRLPARPMIGPVRARVAPKVPQLFKQKFYEALDRYTKGESRIASHGLALANTPQIFREAS